MWMDSFCFIMCSACWQWQKQRKRSLPNSQWTVDNRIYSREANGINKKLNYCPCRQERSYCSLLTDLQGNGHRLPWSPYTVSFKVFSRIVTCTVDIGIKRADERIRLTFDEGRDECHLIVMQWRQALVGCLNRRTRFRSCCNVRMRSRAAQFRLLRWSQQYENVSLKNKCRKLQKT